MGSLRHITLGDAVVLLVMLALRLQASEAEWLVASLLHMRRQLRDALAGRAAPGRPIIRPFGF